MDVILLMNAYNITDQNVRNKKDLKKAGVTRRITNMKEQQKSVGHMMRKERLEILTLTRKE